MSQHLLISEISIFTAENGKSRGSKNKHGRNGEDLIINLPLGCVITDNNTDEQLCIWTMKTRHVLAIEVNTDMEMFI